MPSDPENETSAGKAISEVADASYDPELSAGARHHEAGRFREAEQLYRRVLQRDPNNAEALNLLGVLAAQAGHPRDAKDLMAKSVAIDPNNPEFHYNLALVYQGTGDSDEAIKSYRRAVDLRPEYADAWLNLGGILLNRGESVEAERCSRHAARIAPENPVAHHNLGAALLVRQIHQDAEPCFREALRLKPDYAEALNGLGVAQSGQGRFHEAMESFGQALALRPGYAEAHNALGTALFEQDRLEEAEAEVRKALAASPDLVQARINLANIKLEQDNLEEALALYEEVLQDQPAHAAAMAGKASVLERRARHDEAARIVLPFADTRSLPHPMIAIYAKLARHAGKQQEALDLLQGVELSGPAMASAQRDLHFALGDVLDDLGQHDRAFDHFAAANALRPTDHDPREIAAKTDRIMAFFSAERLADLPRARERPEEPSDLPPDLPPDLPVFLVGAPGSGIAAIEASLARHPRIHAAGALRDLRHAAADLGLSFEGANADADGAMPDEDSLSAASARYLQGLQARAGGAARAIDAQPDNFERLGLIALLFPRARVVHCRRDPLDSCLSCYFRSFPRGNFQTFDLRHLGHFHRQYERLMAHWRQVLDLAVLDVSYEDYAEDPERVCRDILGFLELDWDPACAPDRTPDRTLEAVGRWRNYEKQLAPLREALGQDA